MTVPAEDSTSDGIDIAIEWLEGITGQIDPDVFMTLTFRFDIAEQDAQQALGELLRRLNRRAFPRRNRGRRIQRIPFLERRGTGGRLHYHILLRLPDRFRDNVDAFKRLVCHDWTRLWAINVLGQPFCGGDPLQHDPSDKRWFIYSEEGFTHEDCHNIIRYGLKTARLDRRMHFLHLDCLDAENMYIADLDGDGNASRPPA